LQPILQILQDKLNTRIEEGLFRELKDYSAFCDFSSNDYLGFSRDQKELTQFGSTGSRLISGNSVDIERLELEIANFHQAQSGLIFNSGYVANLGLFSTIPNRGDTVIYDELIHASIRDGIRLSNADSFSFKHNNVQHLEERLSKSKGNIFVAVESIYSMDGDSPDLLKVSKACKNFGANLIVDEAHAVGVVGEKGDGLVAKLDLQKEVFATVITFGKALGCHGAIVLGDNVLRNFLINYCRSFIYTTAPSPETILTIRNQYHKLTKLYEKNSSAHLLALELKKYFITKVGASRELITGAYGNVVSVVIPGNENVRKVSNSLKNIGLYAKEILSPTVPKGAERLRICFHSYNSVKEVDKLIECLNKTINLTK
jgi:8-amino-7-oxononanoate synthase